MKRILTIAVFSAAVAAQTVDMGNEPTDADYFDEDYEDAGSAEGNSDSSVMQLEARRIHVPGWTENLGGRNKKRLTPDQKKNKKKIRIINGLKTSPMGIVAGFKTITEKKVFNSKKMINRFADYGCWCFQTDTPHNKVPAVDESDEACKELEACESCINIDSESDVACEKYPDYNVTISRQDGTITCNDDLNTCKHAYCECHKQFVLNFNPKKANKKFTKARFDPSKKKRRRKTPKKDEVCVAPTSTSAYWDVNGGDYEDGLDRGLDELFGDDYMYGEPIPKNLSKKQDKCCGHYPKRFPFASSDGSHGCCGGKTYNSHKKQCCGDSDDGYSFNPKTSECCENGEVRSFGLCG